MALIERHYNSPRGQVTLTVPTRDGGTKQVVKENFPLIVGEDGIENRWAAGKMADGSEYFTVFAEQDAWDSFDTKYPNQDAQTGDPYCERFPQKNVSAVSSGA